MLRLEYILTSGAQYFDSGYIPTVNTVVEVECCEDPTGAASSTYCLFGTGTSNSDSDGTNFSFFNNVSGSTKVRTYGNYYTIPAATLSPYRRIKLQVDIQGAREIYYIQEGTPYQYASKLIPLITLSLLHHQVQFQRVYFLARRITMEPLTLILLVVFIV